MPLPYPRLFWGCSSYNLSPVRILFKSIWKIPIISFSLINIWQLFITKIVEMFQPKNLMAFKLNPFWIRFILWWYDEEIAMEGIGTAGKIMCFCIFRILSRLLNSTNTCFVFIKESERESARFNITNEHQDIWLQFEV